VECRVASDPMGSQHSSLYLAQAQVSSLVPSHFRGVLSKIHWTQDSRLASSIHSTQIVHCRLEHDYCCQTSVAAVSWRSCQLAWRPQMFGSPKSLTQGRGPYPQASITSGGYSRSHLMFGSQTVALKAFCTTCHLQNMDSHSRSRGTVERLTPH
jgi:hypothetical protein